VQRVAAITRSFMPFFGRCPACLEFGRRIGAI
jgi:hypothetical protein